MTRTKTKVAAGRLKMKDTGRERPAQDPAGRRARDYDGPPVAGTVVLLPVDRIAPVWAGCSGCRTPQITGERSESE